MGEVPSARYRQRTSEGRLTDKVIVGGELTHPYDVANDAYEQLPRNQDVLLPLGDGMLNRLMVRKYNGNYIRQTASREDILERLHPDAFWDEGQVLAPCTKNTVEGTRAPVYMDNHMDHVGQSVYPSLQLGQAANKYPAASRSDLSNADYFKCILGLGNSGQAAFHRLRLEQHRTITSSTSILGSKDNVYDHMNSLTGVRTSGATAVGSSSCARAKNPDLQDFLALSWLHSSATSFVYQFRKDLKALAAQTQYLSNELFSFYQKGFKGDFLRSQNKTQVWLIASLVEFGAALRRHHWTYNGANGGIGDVASVDRNHDMEVISPFYLRFVDTNGVGTEFMPWWVASLYDRGHFDYEGEEHPDIKDIYREDLFVGLKTLLEAASLEQGMAWKGFSMPWMDFFDKFETGTLPDLYDENSLDAVRTLWYTGREEVSSFRNKRAVSKDMATVPYFSNFIDGVTLSKTAPLDLELDLADLDKMPCMTGSRFKEGMQLLGPFEHSCYHRKSRFEDRTVDVKYYPMMFMRPVLTASPFYCDETGSGIDGDIKFAVAAKSGVDDGADRLAYLLNMKISDVETLYKNKHATVEWIGFPSIETGWAVFAEGVLHRGGHIALGYGSTMIGETPVTLLSSEEAAEPFFSGNALGITMTTPELTDTNTGAGNHLSWKCHGGLPLSHTSYWSPGINSILPSLFTVLHDVYASWQNRTSGLFNRSELKGMMSWQSINLRSEMTMTTPNAKLSKYGKEIFNFMLCAGTGWDVGYTARTVDRQLQDQRFHNRNGVPDLLLAPWNMESSGVEDTFSAMHLISMLQGLFGPNRTDCNHGTTLAYGLSGATPGSGGVNDVDPYESTFRGVALQEAENAQRFNARVIEFSLFPRVTGSLAPIPGNDWASANTCDADRGHDPGRASFVRTIYDGPVARDGADRRIAITAMARWIRPDATEASEEHATQDLSTFGPAGKGASWFATAQIPVYNFMSEHVMATPNNAVYGASLEYIPGHRQIFRVWRLDHQTDMAGNHPAVVGVKSLCSSFGVSGNHLATGSAVENANGDVLPGFALGTIPALTYTSEITGLPIVPTEWDNNNILQYFEQRLGTIGQEPSDVRIWTENAPKLLVYDQDLHDHNEAMLGAILDLEYGVNHPGYITLLSVIKYDGSEEYRIEGSYGWEGGVKMEDLDAVEASVTATEGPDYTD